MKPATCVTYLLIVVVLGVFSAPCVAQAQGSPGITVQPTTIPFGAHDIGTTTPKALLVWNNSTASVNLAITISGDNPNDFSWKSTCLSNLPPNGKCEVSVLFSPLTIAKPEDRRAQLAVSNGNLAASPVSLTGSAFQNLGVSSPSLSFDEQLVNTPSAPRSLVLTNYSDFTLSSLTVTVAGDFTEDHATCNKITPGASCAISVVFAPKHPGAASGSLTVSADQAALGKLPRLVSLQGNGLTRCKAVSCAWRSLSLWVIIIGGLYFAGLVLVRWHMIAKPARAQLVAEISAVRSRLMTEIAGLPSTPASNARAERIRYLLDVALYPFKHKRFPFDKDANSNELSLVPGWFPWYTRLFNALFWPRGQELAGWSCLHEAELLLVELLPLERVRARMETAEQELREMKTPTSLALADRLHDTASSASANTLDRAHALLAEALSLIYERGDTDYSQLAVWHSKMIWLVGCALLFICALAATMQNAIFLLLGAVGGLLSRLTRTVRAADVANDYGASWGALFLSPLSGALSAWGGILLIVLALKLNILGSAVKVEWCDPYDPATLAIALLFGFSERLFDRIASQIEDKVLKTPPTGPAAPGSSPAPTISSLDPPKATFGKPVPFTVRGANFQSGATATVTDENGKPTTAKLEFKDAATVVVSATVTGAKAFTSTLTITNPDKQVATREFEATP